MSDRPIPLYIITGFLGSGKTSVINNLLSHLKHTRVGLLLNDFGSIVVDSALVEAGGTLVATKSLSGGQIFCSCLSGSFIESIVAMAAVEPDCIFVESSGLAKPAPLLEIISVIQDRTRDRVVYGGMVCVIDADRFSVLSQSLMTLEEQVVFSDLFIINKTDLAEPETLASITDRIGSLRPLAPVYRTTYGQVPGDLLERIPGGAVLQSVDASGYGGWGLHGRPHTCVFLPEPPYSRRLLLRFLTEVSRHFLRVKGFLPIGDGAVVSVSGVGPRVSVSDTKGPGDIASGLVCIHAASVDAVPLLRSAWERQVGTPCTCVAT